MTDSAATPAEPPRDEKQRRKSPRPKPHWLELILLGIGSLAFFAGTWLIPGIEPGTRVVATGIGIAITWFLANLWFVRGSGVQPKVWLPVVGVQVIALAALAYYYRIDTLDGNMVPKLVRRSQPKPYANLGTPEPTANEPKAGEQEAVAQADENYAFPQFQGPDRSGRVENVSLARDWEASPPELVWKQPIGGGWSSFAIVGERAVTLEQRGTDEVAVCYQLTTGEVFWSHSNAGQFISKVSGDGPRATPTIHEGLVYTLGAAGQLNCLRLEDGEFVWGINVLDETSAENLMWGRSSSPLVVDDLVVVGVGGEGRAVVAYDRHSGERAWSAGDDEGSYSSPTLATLLGERQILNVNGNSLTAHEIETGRVLWSFPWPNSQPNVSQPVPLDESHVFVSSGYGVGCALVELSRDDEGQILAQELWHTKSLKTKFTNVVVHDGFIYGLDDGILVCVDPADGKRRWKEGRYRHGQILLVGGLLLVVGEQSEVVLVEPSPRGLRELGRFTALDGQKIWNTPALSGQYLLLRNDRQAECYALPLN